MTVDASPPYCFTNNDSSLPTESAVDSSTNNETTEERVPCLYNKLIQNFPDDRLYHFGISKSDSSTISMFSNIKFVCTGGSALRIRKFAEMFSKNHQVAITNNLSNTDRYAMYITGPILWVNHGMGVPSLSIMLVEVIKLLHYAKAKNIKFIRLGTSGGIGVEPGTLIVSSGAVNGLLQPKHVQYIYGKPVEHDAILDQQFGDQLYATALRLGIPTQRGLTLCADDFYEGQMRLDGLFCDYSSEDKASFLNKLYEIGVRNIEMESAGFAAYTHRAKIPAAIVCVAIVNRMVGDQVVLEKSLYSEFEARPFKVVSEFIRLACGDQL